MDHGPADRTEQESLEATEPASAHDQQARVLSRVQQGDHRVRLDDHGLNGNVGKRLAHLRGGGLDRLASSLLELAYVVGYVRPHHQAEGTIR